MKKPKKTLGIRVLGLRSKAISTTEGQVLRTTGFKSITKITSMDGDPEFIFTPQSKAMSTTAGCIYANTGFQSIFKVTSMNGDPELVLTAQHSD